MWAAHEHFSEDMNERGHLVSGRALRPSDTATTVRRRHGATLAADGPAAQTAEQPAGFYLVEADDLDQAIEVAARIPSSCHGSIEVRPVVDWEGADLTEPKS